MIHFQVDETSLPDSAPVLRRLLQDCGHSLSQGSGDENSATESMADMVEMSVMTAEIEADGPSAHV